MRVPEISFRELAYGLFVLNVINGFVIICVAVAAPFFLLFAAWVSAGKFFEFNIFLTSVLAITVIIEANIIQAAVLCTRWLFDSPIRRLIVVFALGAWHALLMNFSFAGYFDFSLVALAAALTIETLLRRTNNKLQP